MSERPGELLLTYPELGERLGITPDSARLKAKRKAARGEWETIAPNKEGGHVRVRVPASDIPEHPPERSPRASAYKASDGTSVGPSDSELLTGLAELKASVAELYGVRERAEQVSAEAAQARLEAAVLNARLEAVERAHRAEISAKDTVIAELRKLLDDARRPWWRRLIG